ncbi:hypothetical protein EI94DRAFT_1749084 [Lactarius quietus]|nr:hypothetical protein EI94DRAFT_1749084 [Lactarius quietus]
MSNCVNTASRWLVLLLWTAVPPWRLVSVERFSCSQQAYILEDNGEQANSELSVPSLCTWGIHGTPMHVHM